MLTLIISILYIALIVRTTYILFSWNLNSSVWELANTMKVVIFLSYIPAIYFTLKFFL